MTMKTKRGLAVGGGTVLCAALAILIAARFAPDDKQLTTSAPTSESTPAISVEISKPQLESNTSTEIKKPEISSKNIEEIIGPDIQKTDIADTPSDPEKEAADFIDDGGIEINQDFPEPEKTDSAPQNEPPAPPQIEDEEMLTNPDKEPTYEPEQTEIKPQPETPSDTPKHGDKKDGQIYINGFGWIKDEGGGGIGYTDTEMYQNGNKIGYFG